MTDSAVNSPMSRPQTEVDAHAERYLAAHAALDPLSATFMGLAGYDDKLPDLSPDGRQAAADLVSRTLDGLAGLSPADDVDRVTVAALGERLAVAADLRAIGADLSELNNIASPVQNLRSVFDIMAMKTTDDWSTIATRLGAIPDSIGGYIESLRLAASRGDVAPRRQVSACIEQCEQNLGTDGFFATFARRARLGDTTPLPDGLRADLERGTAAAQHGYDTLRTFLAEELLAQAPEADACGIEKYEHHSRAFLGATVDLRETYEWGQQELARITGLMAETAERITPGATVDEAIKHLDTDPARQLHGTDALQKWMQGKSDAAIEALAGTHFDIAEPIRTLECMIAPTTTGGIYYTGPSDDFSRPGRMWWSVPKGETEFSTWRELTTVYHEGVPGHHLQIAQTVYQKELLNSWRRLGAWTSGHGEGWALYAEWLMADLGFLDDPADFLGMLDGQSLRAARVVLDIGVHCGFDAPAELGGGSWDYDKAWRFLSAHSKMGEGFLRFELDRYLGWPGQAPAYKIGERLWLQLRDETKHREGAAFDLKKFHSRALNIGGVGLDVLRAAVLGEL